MKKTERRKIDTLILHGTIVTSPHSSIPRVGAEMGELFIHDDWGIAIHESEILMVSSSNELTAHFQSANTINAAGKVVTPGLVDAHSHVVFMGDRADEFELQIMGLPYEIIAKRGGGILSTVADVRKATKQELVKTAKARLDIMLSHGTTTVEVKSGYGLSLKDEVKMLEAIKELDKVHPIDIVSTFLGAHVVPAEFAGKKAQYVKLVVKEMLPYIARRKLAECCDVFCDNGAFTVEEAKYILSIAHVWGFQLKMHANEFSANGGARLAAELKALSADHLIKVSDAEIQLLKEAGVIGVLLPGTPFALGLSAHAPARAMIDRGIPIALGTDCNPGTSFCESMTMMMTLACTKLRMNPAEALTAATINSAYAIGKGSRVGSLEAGKQADIVIWDTKDFRHLSYHYGVNLAETVIKQGIIHKNS